LGLAKALIVFAYGSIKPGFYNHARIGSPPSLGRAWLAGASLWTIGHDMFPYLVFNPQSPGVSGVLLDILPEQYAFLESMEKGAGYAAEQVEVLNGAKQEKVKAQVFYLPKRLFDEQTSRYKSRCIGSMWNQRA